MAHDLFFNQRVRTGMAHHARAGLGLTAPIEPDIFQQGFSSYQEIPCCCPIHGD